MRPRLVYAARIQGSWRCFSNQRSITVVQKFFLAKTIFEVQLQIKKYSRRIAGARPKSYKDTPFSAASNV